jgi:hypothetical protein
MVSWAGCVVGCGNVVCRAYPLLGELGMPYTDPAKAECECSFADVTAAARAQTCRERGRSAVQGQLGWVLCGVLQGGVQSLSLLGELGMPYTDPAKAEGECNE